MSLPYDQFDDDIKHLIRQGCSPNEVSQKFLHQYPQFISDSARLLKHIQNVERNVRQAGR